MNLNSPIAVLALDARTHGHQPKPSRRARGCPAQGRCKSKRGPEAMARQVTGPEIERLIQTMAKLPGLGPRSARRAALYLIKNRDKVMGPLATALAEAHQKASLCASAAMSIPATRAPSVSMSGATAASSAWWRKWATCGRSSAPGRSTVSITFSAARCRPSGACARKTSISRGSSSAPPIRRRARFCSRSTPRWKARPRRTTSPSG
jgi:hypothetical protein